MQCRNRAPLLLLLLVLVYGCNARQQDAARETDTHESSHSVYNYECIGDEGVILLELSADWQSATLSWNDTVSKLTRISPDLEGKVFLMGQVRGRMDTLKLELHNKDIFSSFVGPFDSSYFTFGPFYLKDGRPYTETLRSTHIDMPSSWNIELAKPGSVLSYIVINSPTEDSLLTEYNIEAYRSTDSIAKAMHSEDATLRFIPRIHEINDSTITIAMTAVSEFKADMMDNLREMVYWTISVNRKRGVVRRADVLLDSVETSKVTRAVDSALRARWSSEGLPEPFDMYKDSYAWYRADSGIHIEAAPGQLDEKNHGPFGVFVPLRKR